MVYEIKNEWLTAGISSRGGELQSIKDVKGREYIWQGQEGNWEEHGPNLFPYIGRMTDKTYTCYGKTYSMPLHGFLLSSEMELVEKTESRLVMKLESSEATKACYPFEFELHICWMLEGEKLSVTYLVDNRDEKKMYFGIGGHPGFNMPLEEGLTFEDYYIDFGENAFPRRELLSEDCLMLDQDEAYPLRDNRYLDLYHGLFDNDALVFHSVPKRAVIESPKGKRKIIVEYSDMDYLGIWHWAKTESPYVCMEPWSSLPSRKGVVEDLSTQKNLISLESGAHYENQWSVTITEKT